MHSGVLPARLPQISVSPRPLPRLTGFKGGVHTNEINGMLTEECFVRVLFIPLQPDIVHDQVKPRIGKRPHRPAHTVKQLLAESPCFNGYLRRICALDRPEHKRIWMIVQPGRLHTEEGVHLHMQKIPFGSLLQSLGKRRLTSAAGAVENDDRCH